MASIFMPSAKIVLLMILMIMISSSSSCRADDHVDVKKKANSIIMRLFGWMLPEYIDPGHNNNNSTNNTDDLGAVFSHYKLALQWMPTICRKASMGTCPGDTGDFSIHGLWPNAGRQCRDEKLDLNNIISLEDRLMQLWPDSSGTETASQSFWAHEWLMHGTCSEFNQFDYFSTTLTLRAQLGDIRSGILSNNIAPGSTYTKDEYLKAFSAFLKWYPALGCVQNIAGGWYLSEVRPCYTKASDLQAPSPSPSPSSSPSPSPSPSASHSPSPSPSTPSPRLRSCPAPYGGCPDNTAILFPSPYPQAPSPSPSPSPSTSATATATYSLAPLWRFINKLGTRLLA